MKMNDLTPGIYKIRNKSTSSFRNRRGKRLKDEMHLLRVTGNGASRKYFIDHDTIGQGSIGSNFENDYEIISRYPIAPEVNKAQITISFSDGTGDYFEFTVFDAWRLRHLFEEMPWLQKGFGYEPRKAREKRWSAT